MSNQFTFSAIEDRTNVGLETRAANNWFSSSILGDMGVFLLNTARSEILENFSGSAQ